MALRDFQRVFDLLGDTARVGRALQLGVSPCFMTRYTR